MKGETVVHLVIIVGVFFIFTIALLIGIGASKSMRQDVKRPTTGSEVVQTHVFKCEVEGEVVEYLQDFRVSSVQDLVDIRNSGAEFCRQMQYVYGE